MHPRSLSNLPRAFAKGAPLALAASLLAACAQPQPAYYYVPLPSNAYPGISSATWPLYNARPETDDGLDRVVSPPAAATAPSENRQATVSPTAPAVAADPATPAPQTPETESADRSPTCGYWRLGCGVLWQ